MPRPTHTMARSPVWAASIALRELGLRGRRYTQDTIPSVPADFHIRVGLHPQPGSERPGLHHRGPVHACSARHGPGEPGSSLRPAPRSSDTPFSVREFPAGSGHVSLTSGIGDCRAGRRGPRQILAVPGAGRGLSLQAPVRAPLACWCCRHRAGSAGSPPRRASLCSLAPLGAGSHLSRARRGSRARFSALDTCRAWVSDDGSDQDATGDAGSCADGDPGARLGRRLHHRHRRDQRAAGGDREPLLALARESDVPAVAVVFATPLDVSLARNAARPGTRTWRTLGTGAYRRRIVRAQHNSLQDKPCLGCGRRASRVCSTGCQ